MASRDSGKPKKAHHRLIRAQSRCRARTLLFGILGLCLLLTSCNGRGELLKYNGGELYFTSNVSKAEAERLGQYLVNVNFFDGNRKTVQLNREGSTYEFRMVIKKGLEEEEEFIEMAKRFSRGLSQDVFGKEEVDIHLCDEYLETIRVVIDL